MKRKVLIPIGILILAFIIMIALIKFKSEPPKRTPVVRPKNVESEIVRLQNVKSEIIAFGRLTSAQPVILYAEVAGTLEKGDVAFKPAVSFSKGDLLVKIDDRQVLLDLNTAKSDFLNALASVLPEIKVDFPEDYTVFQNYFDNCGFNKKFNPLPQTNNQKIKLFLTRFNVYKLYYAVKNQEIRLEKHYFYAPFDGSIVTTDLRVGSTVRSGSKIGEIINLENLEVEIPVATSDIHWIDQSRPVIFTSSEIPGKWTGKVKRIGKNIDERTQTVQVFASVDKGAEKDLVNGVFLKAHIPGKTIPEAFSVPSRAIYNENFVYLVKNGKLDYREINVARKETDSVIVNKGLITGDTLVTEVLQGVAPGMQAIVRLAE